MRRVEGRCARHPDIGAWRTGRGGGGVRRGCWGAAVWREGEEDEIPSGRGPAAISGEGTLQSFEIMQPTT